jgi:hypothetical protein
MKLYKKMAVLLLCVGGIFAVNVEALDTSGVAQLETTPPSAEGALPTEQTPPILTKTNNNPQGGAAPQARTTAPTNSGTAPQAGTTAPTNGGNAQSAPPLVAPPIVSPAH